ncbi:MAG: uncharacterized protein QOH72_2219 [Solirubrobacteraceae bacterium]|jgi:uncharacterized membrane protein YfcA|nr:uncharacterized protein [Solirubrobacteraceae bacterium]
MDLLLGGIAVALASFLGGVTGFGYSLVATPLLLLDGYPLRFVVTANLALAFVTRISVAVRFRRSASPRRVALLVGGAVPGLWLGVAVLRAVDPTDIKIAAGVVTMIAAALLARSVNAPPPRRSVPGAAAIAGFLGGFLGSSTSLNGVAPVLLLARDKASPRSFLADLAMYFVGANAIGLIILAVQHTIRTDALAPGFLVWLPGSLLGNWLGTTLGPRLPERAFRRLTLVIVFVAGGVTALTA